MTWTELVMTSAPTKGDQRAVSDVRTGEVLSYAAFVRRVTRAAAGLRRHGLQQGEHVIVDVPLGVALPVAVHSVAWAGGIAALRSTGKARMMITLRDYDPAAVKADRVFAFRPGPGVRPFGELLVSGAVDFGPLAGPALTLDGVRVFDHIELAGDLRRVAARLVIGKDDVVISAVSEPFTGLRVLDLAMMAGAHVVLAHDPSVVGCRVLAEERRATMIIAPYDLARRLLGDPILAFVRVVDERAVVSSLRR
ncbi:AMP-binding protein [Nonomuraea turcica]|uniref:AMP-binding protein n=1 Tax=Nonomuraea sp. G32 TaxID=3067274 RepID=UPI00273C689F|nr:AMP-binding protein [Nonomuraea sp. G32]MDP4502915.1 AMP-binding protein [Nonomuraea sp. G32]